MGWKERLLTRIPSKFEIGLLINASRLKEVICICTIYSKGIEISRRPRGN
jgi:hypothetical protein